MAKRIALIVGLLCWSLVAVGHGEDWPQWRGPAGQGIGSDQPTVTNWSESEHVAWKTPIHGKGWSSPVLLGDQIWLTTADVTPESAENAAERLKSNTGGQPVDLAEDVTFFAVGLDKASGKILHDVAMFKVEHPQWVHRMNSYASPSPVMEEGYLYCHFGASGTACVDTTTGKTAWVNRDHEIAHENGPGSSPILEGNLLIFHCDGSDKQYLVALDKATGKTVWKTDRSGKMDNDPQLKKAYGTPLVVDRDGKRVIMSPAANWLYGYEVATGAELFKMPYEKLGFSIVPRPVTANGLLFMSTSFMQPELLAVRYDDAQTPHVEWREKKSVPTMSSPIVVNDLLYFISDNGGVLSCLEAKTGKVVYRERIEGTHAASPIVAGGNLYFCDRNGVTIVVQAGREAKIVAKNTLDGSIMASPAAVDGDLFIRTEHAMYRLGDRSLKNR